MADNANILSHLQQYRRVIDEFEQMVSFISSGMTQYQTYIDQLSSLSGQKDAKDAEVKAFIDNANKTIAEIKLAEENAQNAFQEKTKAQAKEIQEGEQKLTELDSQYKSKLAILQSEYAQQQAECDAAIKARSDTLEKLDGIIKAKKDAVLALG